MAAQASQAGERPQRTLRLTFEYRGTDVRLASQQVVEMMPPPSDRTDEYEGRAGFWIELLDAEGRVVYRRVMHHPIEIEHEAPSGDPDRPFTHVPVSQVQGVFTVLAPDLANARGLRLVGSPPEERAGAAKEIFRADLNEGPRRYQEE